MQRAHGEVGEGILTTGYRIVEDMDEDGAVSELEDFEEQGPEVLSGYVELRYCTNWLSNLTDVGGGEDVYTASGNFLRPAEYSRVRLRDAQDNVLDEDYMTTKLTIPGVGEWYCSKYFQVQKGSLYSFLHSTVLKRSNRQILIMGDSATWTNRNFKGIATQYYVKPDATGQTTYILDHTYISKHTSMAVIARRVLNRAPTVGYPNYSDAVNDQRIYISMRPAHSSVCPNGCCSHSSGICDGKTSGGITGPPGHAICFSLSSNETSVKKYLAGHEIGHAVAHMRNSQGPRPSSYSATYAGSVFEPTNYACQPGGTPPHSHSLHSREFIGAAQGEGFAHFFPAVLFNYRENPDKWFGYWRTARTTNSSSGNCSTTCWVELGYLKDKRHLHNWCPPSGWVGAGVEWDWLHFFWNLWTWGSHQWDFSDIYDVWKNTSSTTKWCCNSPTNCRDTEPPWWLVCPLPGWEEAKFGKMWNHMQYTVNQNYMGWGWSEAKKDRFGDQGLASRVNY